MPLKRIIYSKRKLLFSLIFYASFIGYTQAQQETSLEKFKAGRINFNSLQTKKIEEYLKSPDSIRKKNQINHPSFLLTSISKTGHPIYKAPLNAGAALTTDVTLLQNLSLGLNLQGENMTVGVWDDGLVKDHIELGNRVLSKEGTTAQLHATHVTGTIIAAGINSLAKGMAPMATATTWYFDNDEAEMASLARPDQTGLLFSNHSYGTVTGWTKVNGVWKWVGDPSISTDEDFRAGFYGEAAQSLDQIAYLAPYYTIVWAAGNDRTEVGDGTHPPDGNGGTGYDCIIPEGVAKNIITVGAINKVPSYTGAASAVMSTFSSWGPTDDGRIKPDLVGAGVNVFSLSSSGTNQYATASGTSMATPNVTGSLLLLQELYSKLHAGNFMRAATLKGLAIHTIKEAGPFDGPDYSYGWGLLDVAAAAKVLLQEDNENTCIKELSLLNGQSYSLDLRAQANQKITVTICWTDPQGKPVSYSLDPMNQMLVNDLDVRIIDPSNNVQFPWILNPGSPSSKATTGDNKRDNIEKIEFNNPAALKYSVVVTHKGQLASGKQDFSLIVTYKSSLTTGNTYYWIGSSGNWSDGTHWSLTTGGAPANVQPTEIDNVIVDENSFDGIQNRTINFTADAACKKMTWLTDKASAIALNNNRLKITGSLAVNAKNLKVTSGGIFRFEAAVDANKSVNILKGDITKASVEFNGGIWTTQGNLVVNKVDVLKGSLLLANHYTSIHELNALANTNLTIAANSIDSLQKSSIDQTATFTSVNSTLKIFNSAVLTWDKIKYHGALVLSKNAQVEISGSNTLDSIVANEAAVLKLTGGTTQDVLSLTLNSLTGQNIAIQSNGSKAIINFPTHAKNCFDYLSVSNVDVTGNAVVTAGSHSTVTNSNNWLQQTCDNVSYSDFDVLYTCLNSLTTFHDKSSGAITSWSWNFGDDASSENVSTKQNTYHKFSKSGTFTVSLVISDGNSTQSFSRDVIISNTGLPDNDIVLSSNSLFSFQNSNTYQWFKDGEPITGAISRSYDFKGQVGSFFVVVNTKECNNASTPFVVTGLEDADLAVQILPNPAQDYIKLKLTSLPSQVSLYSLLGQTLTNQKVTTEESILDVSELKEGIYILQVGSSSTNLQRKVIIKR